MMDEILQTIPAGLWVLNTAENTANTSDAEVGIISGWTSKPYTGGSDKTASRTEKIDCRECTGESLCKKEKPTGIDRALPQQLDKKLKGATTEQTKMTDMTTEIQPDTMKTDTDFWVQVYIATTMAVPIDGQKEVELKVLPNKVTSFAKQMYPVRIIVGSLKSVMQLTKCLVDTVVRLSLVKDAQFPLQRSQLLPTQKLPKAMKQSTPVIRATWLIDELEDTQVHTYFGVVKNMPVDV